MGKDIHGKRKYEYSGLLMVSIVTISFVLRAPITSLGPLADMIHSDLGVSNGFIGFLSTLPLIAFSLCSPFVSKLSGKFGIFTTMLTGLVLISAGGLLRSYAGIAGLVIGTALLGTGIATGNVLIPSIVKLRFPDRIGFGTSIFVTAMGVFASVGAGISYPLAAGFDFGWKNALAVWSAVALLALMMWIPHHGLNKETKYSEKEKAELKGKKRKLWKTSLAWYLTMYMGFQSFLFYSVTAWLPSIALGNGLAPETAGYMALGFQLIGIPASFFTPILASRIRKQSRIVLGTCVLYLIGFFSMLTTGPLPLLLITLAFLSIGAAASFSWIMTMIGLCSCDAEEAAELSGMSQSVGYMLAAFGPTLCGMIFDRTGTWMPVVFLIAVITVIMTGFGLLAVNMNSKDVLCSENQKNIRR